MIKIRGKKLGQLIRPVSFILVLALFITLGGSAAAKTDLTISAAASLKGALEAVSPAFEQQFPQVKLIFNFGASGALQQQIEQGAPVDIFISAASKQIEVLASKDLIIKDSVRILFGNSLVLIIPRNRLQVFAIQDLQKAEVRRIAVGESRSVPAGQYAEEALKNLELWPVLQKKLVPAANVRQVLTYVETANVDAGFVYATDALESSAVRVVGPIDGKLHSPVIYPLAIIKKTKQIQAARQFSDFLKSPLAQEVFQKKGFILLPEKAS